MAAAASTLSSFLRGCTGKPRFFSQDRRALLDNKSLNNGSVYATNLVLHFDKSLVGRDYLKRVKLDLTQVLPQNVES